MTVQFDTNSDTSSLGVVPIVSVDSASKQTVAPESTAKLLIDWNSFRPDGTEAALQRLLESVAEQFPAQTHFGRALPSGGVTLEFSAPTSTTESDDQASRRRAAIVEASFAVGRFLVASDQDVTSGVLENLRTAQSWQFAVSFAIPDARNPTEPAIGLVIGLPGALPTEFDLAKRLTQLRIEMSEWLSTWQAYRDAGRVSGLTRMLRKVHAKRAKWLAAALMAGCLALLIPLPYWPQRPCVVEPSARRFVSSPIEGRVLRSLVRPGDVVEAGQLIGRMDDEQLRLELSAAQAELEQAGKQQDTALAHQEGGKMRLAQLEQQKVALKIQSLQAQLERLELRSPVTGVVLQGEWYRSEGAAVARGDTLFEIAPLETMTVQVHLTTEDLGEIAVEDTASVHVDSAMGAAWDGKLTRIDPRASVIDEEIRFVADMEVVNRENRLRPGMKGSVRIHTGFKSLGWLIFHRPYTWLMKNLVW